MRGPPCLGAQAVSPTPCPPAISYRGLPCRLPALHRCKPVAPRLLCSGGVLYGNDRDCQTLVSATRRPAEVDHVRFSWSPTWSLHDTGFPGGSHCEFTNTTRMPGSTFISAQPHGFKEQDRIPLWFQCAFPDNVKPALSQCRFSSVNPSTWGMVLFLNVYLSMFVDVHRHTRGGYWNSWDYGYSCVLW